MPFLGPTRKCGSGHLLSGLESSSKYDFRYPTARCMFPRLVVKDNPQYQQDKLETLFTSKNWQIIYTPPYTHALQPIEFLWAEVKRRVADRFKYGRRIKLTRLQMLHAFYGIENMKESENETDDEKKVRRGVTPELVKSYIEHSNKACQEFIDADEHLTGTIKYVQIIEPTNAQMSHEDQEALEGPEDMQDQSGRES